MEQNIFSKIIRRFLAGRFSSRTEERVQKWILNEQDTEYKEKASLEYWNELESTMDSTTYAAWERVNKRTGNRQKQPVKVPLYRKISRVAAILLPLLILSGIYFYYDSTKNKQIEITVAFGDTQQLFLPDSTEIWLNAGTTIRYPQQFKGNQRLVHLDGEAYFSVTKDETKPFIVETRQLTVRVLGTQFNIQAYPEDDKAVTTLTSGKVRVDTGTENSTILNPNEQLTYNSKTSTVEITHISSQETNGWLTGQLIFNASSLDEITRTLERRFNISIENNTAISSSKVYTIKFLRNESPEEILNLIKDIAGIDYQKDANKFILTNK